MRCWRSWCWRWDLAVGLGAAGGLSPCHTERKERKDSWTWRWPWFTSITGVWRRAGSSVRPARGPGWVKGPSLSGPGSDGGPAGESEMDSVSDWGYWKFSSKKVTWSSLYVSEIFLVVTWERDGRRQDWHLGTFHWIHHAGAWTPRKWRPEKRPQPGVRILKLGFPLKHVHSTRLFDSLCQFRTRIQQTQLRVNFSTAERTDSYLLKIPF